MSHWPTPKRQSIFERLRAISIVLVFCSYFLLSIYIRSHLEGSDSRLWLKTPFVLGSGYIALQAVDLLAKPYLIYFSYSIPEKVGYLIYSPQFAAGPVEKSRSLISALRSPIIVSNSKRLESSFKYLIPGLLRKAILVPIIYSIFSSTKESASSLGLIGSALAFPIPYLYLYQEIQAYTEIAQGVSALAGIPLLINFREPFRAVSFSDFFKRWHISVSEWFNTFIGKPAMKIAIKTKFLEKYAKEISGSIVFFAFGIWHGFSANSLFCGILLALGYILECWTKKIGIWNKALGWIYVQSIAIIVSALLMLRETSVFANWIHDLTSQQIIGQEFISPINFFRYGAAGTIILLIGLDSTSNSLFKLINNQQWKHYALKSILMYSTLLISFSVFTFNSNAGQDNYVRLDF